MNRPRIGSLCSGYGGLDLAVEQFFDAETVWFSEFDDAPSRILAQHWPGVPNLGDMTKVDWSAVEPVDIIAGGTPCQDLSGAGKRRGMTEGTRSNLWVQMREAIAIIRPAIVVWENVRGAYSACAESEIDSDLGRCPRCADPASGADHAPNLRALGRVLGDLDSIGFDAEWVGLRASDAGAPHERFRVFVIAYRRGEAPEFWAAFRRPTTSVEHFGDRSALLKTPTSQLAVNGGSQHPDKRKEGCHGPTLADEIEHLLPTIVVTDAKETRNATAGRTDGSRHHSGQPITDVLSLLPTPTTAIADGGNARRGGDRSHEELLPGIALHVTKNILPTPDASASNDGERPETWLARAALVKAESGANNGMPLAIVTQLLPTPRAALPEAKTSARARELHSSSDSMGDVIAMLPNPQAHDAQGGKRPEQVAAMRARGHGVSNLNEVAPLLPTPRATRGASSTEIMYALGGERDDEGDEQGNVTLTPAFATTSVEEYEALWEALEDQSPFWVTAEGKDYWPAIQRWGQMLGRPAPAPTLPNGKDGNHRLSARLTEWMMGQADGWITAPEIGLTRNEQLRVAGNGVVTQQAVLALHIAWPRILEAVAA